jgi:hypothetical protein
LMGYVHQYNLAITGCMTLGLWCTQGVLVTRKGEAERVTELSANPKGHIQKLQDLGRTERPEGNVRRKLVS